MSEARIYVVDDERAQAETLCRVLKMEGFNASAYLTPGEALHAISVRAPDAVVSDYRMAGMNGLELWLKVKERHADLLFILATAYASIEVAVAALKSGVHDYITKPLDTDELVIKLRKALAFKNLTSENVALKKRIANLTVDAQIVASSPVMMRVLDAIDQIAPTAASVLIQGESGTGKEMIARALHTKSPRSGGPYVKVNCAAIPENLLEDELFGHVAGAFTGALGARKGKFEVAHGGTIFLDEIGELPLHLQTKLLRVLQEREFERVGGNDTLHVDVRVLAATNRDLQDMVRQGEYREDLYYRLAVIPIVVPPLRDRPEDVRALAAHFLHKFCTKNGRELRELSQASMSRLLGHSWPGNVRELENCIERAVVLARGDELEPEDLMFAGETKSGATESILEQMLSTSLTLDELENRLITMALSRCDGNVSRTARHLGLTRRALQYRIEKLKAGESGLRDANEGPEDGNE